MDTHAPTPSFKDVFGNLSESSANFLWWGGMTFPYVDSPKYKVLEQAILAGYSLHTIYRLLNELPSAGEYDDMKPQHRGALNIVVAHAPLSQRLLDGIVKDWSDYPNDLCRGVYPFIPDSWTIGMAKRGLSLVRDADCSLHPIEWFEKIVESKDQAASFFLSALCTDDLEAVDHLRKSALLRSFYTERNCSDAVDGILKYDGAVPENKSSYFEGQRPFPRVIARYHHPRVMRDYWENIAIAIADESLSQMIKAFDPNLSRRLGSDAFLEIEKDKLTGDKLLVAQAFLVKHIKAGADCKLACLTLLHGRIAAMDFMDEPLSIDEVIDESMSKERRYALFPIFLLLFPIEELVAHPRSKECLAVLHSITRDPSYLPLIDDLQYQSAAFAEDLGL